MQKLWRNYRAEFEIGIKKENNERIPQQELIISLPFTLIGEVDTGISHTSNKARLQFINLSPDNRDLLYMDMWNRSNKYIRLNLYAGYGDNLPLIFRGDVFRCSSYKEGGSTEFITEMETCTGFDIFRYGYMNVTFTKGTTLEDIIKYSTNNGEYERVGYITPDILPLNRDRTFIGQPIDLIRREYTGYSVFISNDGINILGDRDVVPGEVLIFSDDTGLLGSPRRGDGLVEWDSVFEPLVKIGQAVILNSSTLSWLNRAYKVLRVVHKFTISTTICGRATTHVTANLAGKEGNFQELKKPVQASYTKPPTKGKWRKPTDTGKITSPFGKRNKPNEKASSDHAGIDIGVNTGTPVYAVASGKVIFAAIKELNGKFVTIDHGKLDNKDVQSWYLHLNKLVVNPGQVVSQGQLIAYSGNTGNSKGPHLHFGIKEGSTWVNPTQYIGTY